MRNINTWFVMFLIAIPMMSGCSSVRTQDVPVHDRMLVYEVPFDLAYLRTMEALEQTPDWELQETEKEKGIIVVRNTNFSLFSDSDKREAMVVVKRVNREETAVLLAPHSQKVVGGDLLLSRIQGALDAEV